MDAYDIFKKLSRGAKFSKPKNGNLQEKVESQNPPVPEIQTPPCTVNSLKGEKRKHSTSDSNVDNGLTVLTAFGSDQEERQSKKIKHLDETELGKKQQQLKTEEINHYRNLNKITVVGRHVPDPARTFEDFTIKPDLIENLRKCGYEEPTPIQKQAIPIMLQRRQVLACAPTGSGKTAAFLVPVIQELQQPERQGFRALILCPTRELAKQTQRECVRSSEGRGLRIHVISKIKLALSNYGPKSSQKFDILITTPNRLCYLLNQDPPAISLSSIKWLIIDEADRLFEAGNRSFREQLDQILAACSNSERKIAMFSATHTPVVAKWCVHNMKGLIRVTVGHRNAATDSVEQELLFVGNEKGKLLAFRDLVHKGLNPPVLVFVQSKDRAQQLFNELIYDGLNVDAIHADRTQLQRDNTVRAFREGKIWVLICTELMARGIDFKGVNLVINYDFPPSAISYVHRIGRAGRAGQRGKAITFFTLEDKTNLRSIAHIITDSGGHVPDYMLSIKKRPKKERKQLEKSAPKRDDISTILKYQNFKKRKYINNGKKKIKPNDSGSKNTKPKDPEAKAKYKKAATKLQNGSTNIANGVKGPKHGKLKKQEDASKAKVKKTINHLDSKKSAQKEKGVKKRKKLVIE